MEEIWRDKETLRLWNSACDPRVPASGSHYVDLDKVALRGPSVIEQLVGTIELSTGESCQLVSGFPGVGKSSLLRAVAERLEKEGIRVVTADVRELDTFDRVQRIAELAVVIAAGLSDAVETWLAERGGHPAAASGDRASDGRAWRALTEFFKKLGLKELAVSGEIETPVLLEATGIPKAKLSIRAALGDKLKEPEFRDRLRATLQSNPRTVRDEFHAHLAELRGLVDQEPGRVAFLVDGLEKYTILRDPVETTREIAALYSANADWFRVAYCHVVYCVPALIGVLPSEETRGYDAVLPPMACVRLRSSPQQGAGEGTRCDAGYAALRELLRARGVDERRLFGTHAEDVVDTIIALSGGHPRHFLEHVRIAIRFVFGEGRHPDADEIRKAILYARTGVVRDAAFDRFLATVAKTKQLTTTTAEQLAFSARSLSDLSVLAYSNGERWYDVHPMEAALLRSSTDAGHET